MQPGQVYLAFWEWQVEHKSDEVIDNEDVDAMGWESVGLRGSDGVMAEMFT